MLYDMNITVMAADAGHTVSLKSPQMRLRPVLVMNSSHYQTRMRIYLALKTLLIVSVLLIFVGSRDKSFEGERFSQYAY